jgi:hypothetical protein
MQPHKLDLTNECVCQVGGATFLIVLRNDRRRPNRIEFAITTRPFSMTKVVSIWRAGIVRSRRPGLHLAWKTMANAAGSGGCF